ncbi:PHD and RING finger domain-containing protein 1 isoform X1 [Oncorhynchus mykiss]|uniref:PHD and RING finger domain-containing protein 1 isoform X1 n=1 Tax=Oncorhynchus mykiss TaxID=8022 RepID=UPI001877C381|nr:PHD and RING finger domain-containing protein 1 isoform X1 [Oncorhynchus mykiss]
MDEEDSQDELINRNATHGKGKRPALWAISDEDSDDGGEESEEGASDSGEEEHLDGEEDEEDDSDDDEEEDAVKEVEGAVGGVSADLAGLSSDEDTEKCPICLNSFHSQPVATPESCKHYFCLDCILEWSKNANSCPVDRIVFNNIYLRKCYGGKVQKMITVQKPVKEGQEEVIDLELEQTSCEVCGGSDREDRLLLCDGCDAGYHMECLTPPLDAVPVEEWFCPECQANNRHSRGSEELSDVESLSSARPTTSRSRPRTTGPTRAIARTQQSERVRASVNRHRITQARTAQIAPSFLMPQSTWLDDTINAVVAGLNTAVYIRDLTPRAPSSRRRRTVKRRKGSSKRSSGEKGKAAGTGGKRRKRRVRRSKSRRKMVVKKEPTSRGRIAHNLGIGKPKWGSSLPSVYRPTETTLGSMRADIGAASLSVYGDPFDLDPFTDRNEEEEEHASAMTSLLEAKRHGLSRSALRSHQPVARPITAGLSRRGPSLPQVAALAPVPDLLGSILSGQSMLLMDSSDVVINRDGSLKATKPVGGVSSSSRLGSSRSSSSGESVAQNHSGMSPNPEAVSSLSLPTNGDLGVGPSCSPLNRPSLSSPGPCSSPLTPPSPCPASHSQTSPPPRPSPSLGQSHWGATGVQLPHRTQREATSTTTPTPDSRSRGRETVPPQPQAKKAAPKPVWEAPVSVLPRIPKIKRESGGLTNGSVSRGGSSSRANGNGFPEACVNSLGGNRGRQPRVDQQQQGRTEGQTQRQRPEQAGSSSAFSSSFSSSSDSPANPALASTVCFRINASGNAWHARQLNNASAMFATGNSQEPLSTEEEAVKRRREERSSKQRPLATSHTQVKEEEGDIYDPFHPTGSDSNASESEGESHAGGKLSMAHKECTIYQVKAEALENRVSLERDEGSGEVLDVKSEADTAKPGHGPHNAPRSGMTGTSTPLSQSHVPGKKERKEQGGKNREPQSQKTDHFSSSSASSHHSNKMVKTEIKSEPQDSPPKSLSRSKSNSRPSGHGRKTSKGGESSTERGSTSNSPEAGRRRGDKAPEQQGRKRGDKEGKRGEEGGERRSRRSESRERRLLCSPSDSSTSETSERSRKKKRRSCSLSKDRRRSRSRSGSGSSSRERSQSRKQKMGSRERNDSRGSEREKGRPSNAKKRGHSQSRSRSRSRERRKDHSRSQPSSSGSKNRFEVRSKDKKRPRSRSRSRERRKEEGSSQGTHRPGSFSTTSSKELEEQKEKIKEKVLTLKEEREAEEDRKEREIKQEMPSSSGLKPHSVLSVCQVKKESDGNEFRTEKHASLSAKLLKESKLLKEIKKEILPAFDMFEESLDSKPIKEEKPLSMFSEFKDLQEHKEIKKEKPPPSINEVCALPTSDITEQKDQVLKETKTEPIWPELPQQLTSIITVPPTGQPSPSFSTLRTNPVPAPSQAAVTTAGQQVAPSLPLVPKALTETPPSVQTIPVKEEVEEHSDYELDDMDVDMMLDSLDYVKSEKAEPGGEKGEAEVKEAKEGEEVKTVTPGVKAKPSAKRVTWNLQEPDGPQPEKTGSKLALYKLKLKQEGARRPASSAQASNQEAALGNTSLTDPKVQSTKRASVSLVLPSALSSSNSLPQVGLSKPVQGEPNEALGEDDASRNDNYIKKLHMQERAIKEVKLAIKPFYQKKDITKDEYKEIVRKAVQKVCHSKSGEINPVKVANLVKAYVDKYKHDRKHRKGEEEAETDRTNDPETP